MRKTASLVCSILLFAETWAAGATLFSINSLTPIGQTFDVMGSDSQAFLPAGWQLNTASSFPGLDRTQYSAGTSGAGAISPGSPGGFYNFANGVNSSSSDRAVGYMASSLVSPTGNVLFGMLNNTGAQINQVNLSFDIEKYRTGTQPVDMKLWMGFDGANWPEAPEAIWHFNSDSGAPSAVNPPSTINCALALTGLGIADQGHFFLRWQYTSLQNLNAQALGIDNVAISFAQPRNLTWMGGAGTPSTWDDVSGNWKDQANSSTSWNDAVADNATFIDAGPAVGTAITLSSPRRVGKLTFNAGAKTYTISGHSIELLAPPAPSAPGIGIDARSNAIIESAINITHEQHWDVAANLAVTGALSVGAGGAILIRGGGSITFSGPLTFNPTVSESSILEVSGGTLHLASNATNADLLIDGATTGGSALVKLEVDQDLAELLGIDINESVPHGLDLNSPTTTGAFRSLRIHASNLSSAKSAIHGWIGWAKTHPGDGIFDSTAQTHGATLGAAIMPGGYILVRPTQLGDLNLDGAVTIADFIALASHFNQGNATWQEGDINFDNSVTIADFISLASNFNRTYSGETFPISPSDSATLNSFAAAQGVAIPEPLTTLLLLPLAALRRRRLQ